jgi:hypothetical protein
MVFCLCNKLQDVVSASLSTIARGVSPGKSDCLVSVTLPRNFGASWFPRGCAEQYSRQELVKIQLQLRARAACSTCQGSAEVVPYPRLLTAAPTRASPHVRGRRCDSGCWGRWDEHMMSHDTAERCASNCFMRGCHWITRSTDTLINCAEVMHQWSKSCSSTWQQKVLTKILVWPIVGDCKASKAMAVLPVLEY